VLKPPLPRLVRESAAGLSFNGLSDLHRNQHERFE